MLPNLSVVLGGASSGKSDLAERLALATGLAPVYLASAQAHDTEMASKIARHRAARSAGWRTVEAPLDAAAQIAAGRTGEVILFDCATLWLTNHILGDSDIAVQSERLLQALTAASCPVVVVSNEVGQGIVPDTALGRRFRDAQGRLNRQLAERADLVIAVMAGLPLVLKGARPTCL